MSPAPSPKSDSAVLELLACVLKAPLQTQTSAGRADETRKEILSTFGSTAAVVGPTGPTYSSDVIAVDKAELWLSDYGNLATILGEDAADPTTMQHLARLLEHRGWKVIPERIVATPIDDRSAMSWFSELFGDY